MLFIAAKLRPVAAPIVSALEPSDGGSSEIELAILIPQGCEKGELRVRYVERLNGISVKAQYRRKSILPPTEFSCTLDLREFGSIVRVAIRPDPGLVRESDQSSSRPKSIADLSQSIGRPVLYVPEFRSHFQEPFGPGLEVRIERVRILD